MKTCPKCGTRYSDDTLSFCLQDGTPLVGPVSETPTVVFGETETAAARRDAVRMPVRDPESGSWGQSQVTQVTPVKPEKKGSNTALAVALTAVGMLLLFGFIGFAAIVFLRNSQQAGLQTANTTPGANIGELNTGHSSSPMPSATASPVRTSTASTPVSTPPSSLAATPVLSSYPSTTRLKFARGSYVTSFSGDVNPADSRSMVLSCRSGQSLSANLSSGSACVTFRGGGTSLRTTTSGGDNYLTVTNHCSSVGRFSINITII